MPASRESKICVACGRAVTWRKKWARDWDHVKFCGDACRRGRATGPSADALERAVLDLLAARARGDTICPSEAARAVSPDAWRDLLQPARAAARRLVAAGRVVITQKGRIVDPSTARGPIRVRLV